MKTEIGIPLCDKTHIHITDKQGREYNLKYLTEFDKQVKYLYLTQREEKAISDMEKIVEKEVPASDDAEKRADEIRLEAWVRVQEERRNNIRKYLSDVDEYINIFVDGDNPAASLKLYEKFPLYREIQANIGALTGLTGEEIKN
ncbi:MAG: hypothetical protein PHN88_14830 [Ignavibacteria bacterium]|nr:hypothetical protein [Ignavibacteria bacterium]